MISSAGAAERSVYLEKEPTDKPNGFYDRSLQLGTIPVDVRVPRTRTGEFRPTSLPPHYRRGYSEEVQSLLLGLLGSSRSINAAKDALHKMGLSNSEQDLERVATGMIEELELRNSRPLDPDMLAVFVDGKYVELRDGDKLRSACIYLVVGLGHDGKKRILSCIAKPGRDISSKVSTFFAKQVLDRTLVPGQVTRRRQNSNCCSHKFLFSVVRCGVAHRGRVQASAVLRCGKEIVNHRKQKLHLRSLPAPGTPA